MCNEVYMYFNLEYTHIYGHKYIGSRHILTCTDRHMNMLTYLYSQTYEHAHIHSHTYMQTYEHAHIHTFTWYNPLSYL